MHTLKNLADDAFSYKIITGYSAKRVNFLQFQANSLSEVYVINHGEEACYEVRFTSNKKEESYNMNIEILLHQFIILKVVPAIHCPQ